MNCVGQEYTGVYTTVHHCRALAGRVRREVSWNGGSCARWIQDLWVRDPGAILLRSLVCDVIGRGEVCTGAIFVAFDRQPRLRGVV